MEAECGVTADMSLSQMIERAVAYRRPTNQREQINAILTAYHVPPADRERLEHLYQLALRNEGLLEQQDAQMQVQSRTPLPTAVLGVSVESVAYMNNIVAVEENAATGNAKRKRGEGGENLDDVRAALASCTCTSEKLPLYRAACERADTAARLTEGARSFIKDVKSVLNCWQHHHDSKDDVFDKAWGGRFKQSRFKKMCSGVPSETCGAHRED
jgi:hypothetical protein